jgi:hypothetical protein
MRMSWVGPLTGPARRPLYLNSPMRVRRIKPNIPSDRFDESRAFYQGVIGLEEQGGLDWISFFGSDRSEVQLSVTRLDIKAHTSI